MHLEKSSDADLVVQRVVKCLVLVASSGLRASVTQLEEWGCDL